MKNPKRRPCQLHVELYINTCDIYKEGEYKTQFPVDTTPYDVYVSRCREAALKAEMTKARFALRDGGFSNDEIMRVLLEVAQDICKRKV